MSTEKMRKSFKEWANTHYLLSELKWAIEDGEYEEPEMQYAWEAWQASREALVIELPEKWGEYTEAGSAACDAIDGCREAIESLGLKVKP